MKVTSPLDAAITEGHLCVKGRFGFTFVGGGGSGGTAAGDGGQDVPPKSVSQSSPAARTRPLQ